MKYFAEKERIRNNDSQLKLLISIDGNNESQKHINFELNYLKKVNVAFIICYRNSWFSLLTKNLREVHIRYGS